MAIEGALNRAAAALAAGRLDEAEALLDAAGGGATGDINAQNLRGLLRLRQGRAPEASAIFESALSVWPTADLLHLNLAAAALSAHDPRRAEQALRQAITLGRRDANVLYDLGRALVAQQRDSEAGGVFLEAARTDPMRFDALQAAVDAAARLVRKGAAPPSEPQPQDPDPERMLSVVVCSITPSRLAKLRADLSACLDGTPWELIHIDDARSLNEGYRRGLERASADAVVFCHDDIQVLDPHFRARLMRALCEYDVVGVAGSDRVTGPAVFWSGHPHVHGWITHVDADGGLRAAVISAIDPHRGAIAALDGLFIAGRRSAFERIGFDAETFDGFHFYDLDFCYRAQRAGLSLGLCGGLLLVHHSRGGFGEDYWRYAERFLERHPEIGKHAHSRHPLLFEACLSDTAQVRAFYAWIACWLGADSVLSDPARSDATA